MLAAAQGQLGEVGQLRHVDAAQKPEPGDAEHRLEHGEVLVGEPEDVPGLGQRIPVDLQVGRGGRGRGNRPTAQVAEHRQDYHHARHPVSALLQGDQHAAQHGAQQNGEIGGHLHPGVAADQFFRLQMLGQDAVFGGAKQGGLKPHQEQQGDEQTDITGDEPHRRAGHDDDFQQFDPADVARLFVLVAQLAGGGREQKERQYKQAGAEIDQEIGMAGVRARRLERDQDDQGVFEDVVVERPQKLSGEERQEPPLLEQGEFVAVGHAAERSRIG